MRIGAQRYARWIHVNAVIEISGCDPFVEAVLTELSRRSHIEVIEYESLIIYKNTTQCNAFDLSIWTRTDLFYRGI